MTNTIVKLSRSYESHGKTFDSVTLRPPKWRDYMEIGEIQEPQPGANGVFVVTYPERIEAYALRLSVGGERAPDGADLMSLDLADTMRVREAIIDFFAEARRQEPSSTSSSGGDASASVTPAN